MKKLMLILCYCCLLPLQASAQGPKGVLARLGKYFATQTKKPTVGAVVKPSAVAETLHMRAFDSAVRATLKNLDVRAQGARIPYEINRAPITRADLVEGRQGPNDLELAQAIFPQQYLQGKGEIVEANIANYVQAANNRLLKMVGTSILNRKPRVPEILERVNSLVTPFGKPKDPAYWLAQQVPLHTRVLVVGEGFYNNPSTVDATSAFLADLRLRMPDRKIVLLSYRLDKGVEWTPELNPLTLNHHTPGRDPFYKKAYDMGIKVIGMYDQKFNHDGIILQSRDSHGYPHHIFWSNSYQAAQLEGNAMLEQLQMVKRQNPDALIIMHVDQEQASLNLPFSMANKLERGERDLYVVSITSKTRIPSSDPFPGEEDMITTRTTQFEQMYQEAHLPDEGAVTRDLAEDVGHDAWIKIPYDEAKRDTGLY